MEQMPAGHLRQGDTTFQSSLNGADVPRIVLDYHASQGLAPFAMPPAVFVERIEDLAEQMVTLTQG